ncbi:MAG: NAD(P)/FAD-dependent oxidoreductase [Planctomycetales bacterium]
MPDWDVLVIGAGAAGLLAATRAAELGLRTALLEKNGKAGVKILMSGGTRCNVTHATDARGIVMAFGTQGRFLHSALASLGPQEIVELLAAEGVPTKVEATGKVFPRSDKAADVLQGLLRRLQRSGAQLALDEPVCDIRQAEPGWQVVTAHRTWTCSKLIVTTGGRSYPGCGTTGDGYLWMERLGHTLVPSRPALVPVTTSAPWVHALKGITVSDVGVRVAPRALVAEGEPSSQAGSVGSGASRGAGGLARCGSFLFTHFGVSGPAVLDVSREITGLPQPQSLALECDFLPGLAATEFDARLRALGQSAGRKQLSSILPEELPRRLTDALLQQTGIDPGQRAAELSAAQRGLLVSAFKQCQIPVEGTLGFAKAEVTAGGVTLAEVDSRTMQSKVVPGLYLAGEILDLDGPIGGYNFQAAFSTGWLAGGVV